MLPEVVALTVLFLIGLFAFPISNPELIFTFLLTPWALVFSCWIVAIIYRGIMWKPPVEFTDDYEIRIITVGKNVGALKATVAACPKPPMIVSRRETGIPGTVVVPDDTGLNAKYKGEAQEWARRTYPRVSGFTLYIDEDTILPKGFRMPADGDIVQLEECPQSTNWLIEAVEAHRSGFAVEMALFEHTKFPAYMWGGAVAIGTELENDTTWNRPTICEDSAFAYAIRQPFKYRYSGIQAKNQAPSTLFDLFKQRRRWTSGTVGDIGLCPSWTMRGVLLVRAYAWAFTIPIAVAGLIMHDLHWVFWLPLFMSMLLSFVGSWITGRSVPDTILNVLLGPIASCINSVGTIWAFFHPVMTFDVTPKRITT